jgi:hypothetical protein
MSLDQPIFDGHVPRANVLPAGEIFTVKQLFPIGGLREGGGSKEQRRQKSKDQSQECTS